MIPIPKYEMGQTVYYGTTLDHSETLPCPDCAGSKEWTVSTPAGESFTVPCQRCSAGYRAVDLPSMTRRVWRGSVRALTVGQIKIETPVSDSGWGNEAVNYMCRETGVGSGSVYRESQLFADEAGAQAVADIEAARQTAEWAAKPDIARPREIARLTLETALGESARHTIWTVCYHAKQLREKVEGWLDSDSDFAPSDAQHSAIQDALADLEWHDSPKQNPLIALVLTARAIAGEPNTGNPELIAALEPFAFVRAPKPSPFDALTL